MKRGHSTTSNNSGEGAHMMVAKLSNSGRGQAVELPEECRFDGAEVYVKRLENLVMLIAKDDPWAPLVDSLDRFSADFMADRHQPPQQIREKL